MILQNSYRRVVSTLYVLTCVTLYTLATRKKEKSICTPLRLL